MPLDVLHSIKHKQPHELLIPILNIANTDIKILKKYCFRFAYQCEYHRLHSQCVLEEDADHQ